MRSHELERKRTRKTRLAVAVAIFAMASTSSVLADCPKVTVYNQSSEKTRVTWVAEGCAGVEHGHSFVCESKTVQPGETTSYSFKWGTTQQMVWAESSDLETSNYTLTSAGYFTDGAGNVHNAGCDEYYTVIYDGGEDQTDEAGYLLVPGEDRCVNAMHSDFENGTPLWMWNHCVDGNPQKNRVWQWNEDHGTITSVFDSLYCFRLTQTSGPVDGDVIRLWACTDGSGPNKSWDYVADPEGGHRIVLRDDPEYCMVRAHNDKEAGIFLRKCDDVDHDVRSWDLSPH